MFTERARAHDDTFALDDSVASLVGSICRRLDGVPLAIELAAARLASMSLVHLNERLDQRFRLLTGGARNAVARQRTLQAAVDWSFELLSSPEQAVLARLSVFVGGFELDAAEAVCGGGEVELFEVADLLGSLVQKSLVVAERSSGSLRYRLLETTRQYAADQLVATTGAPGVRRVQQAHASFYLQLAEAASPELTGPRQGSWLKRLDLEWDNVRAALAYFFGEPDRTKEVLRLGVALHLFFLTRGHVEPVGYLRAALERADPLPDDLRARALVRTGHLVAMLIGLQVKFELPSARELIERALDLARDLDDAGLLVEALSLLSGAMYLDEEPSRALGEESLGVARSVGDPYLIGLAVEALAIVEPEPELRRALFLEALRCWRQAGDLSGICIELGNLAFMELLSGQLAAARAYSEEAATAAEEIGAPWLLSTLQGGLGILLLLQGELEGAAVMSRRSLITGRRLGNRVVVSDAVFVLACYSTGTGDYRRAAQLTGAHDLLHADLAEAEASQPSIPLQRLARDENRARLREILGEDSFEREYGIGRGLGYVQAVDLALGRTNPPTRDAGGQGAPPTPSLA